MLKILLDNLAHAKTENYTLDMALFYSLKDLSHVKDGDDPSAQPYGPRALIFGLVGNGNVRMCLPNTAK